MLTLTGQPVWLDIGPDGSLYMDQIDKLADLLRFAPASGALFDPATGRVVRVPGGDQVDMGSPGWANDGRLVTVAVRYQGSLWRFRPENEAR